ncbi:GAF domain-containing protein [Serratia odorifera]|jgi:hypothetical protein|uniref:GAF domain-containing protein n=1 Tax=Serratia odorifera TaxID=618 RepID=UPI0018E83045|nr:GAF domain-containing protein [Serratia odorifera]MBJ2066257.1 GAF domain-containing protein [Serratia odorifera]
MDTQKIEKVLKKNRYINARFASHFISMFNVWNTLLAPIIIGVGVSYIFQYKDDITKISNSFFILCFVFVFVHLVFAIAFNFLDKRGDTTNELTEVSENYNGLVSDIDIIKERMKVSNELNATQKIVIYLTTLKVNSHIKELMNKKNGGLFTIEELDGHIDEFIDTIINYLSKHRETLFGYESKSRYNIALYVYDPEEEKLVVTARRCDDRIDRKDRSWKSGFGHVGLTYLHKELKICPNINNSSELKITNSSDKINYCSFISVPILTYREGDAENDCLGVLVLTSALPEQFSLQRDKDFLQNISSLIAIYIDVVASIYKEVNK